MSGGHLLQTLPALECLDQALLLLGRPRPSDILRLLCTAAGARSPFVQGGSVAELANLLEAANKVVRSRESPALTVLRIAA